MRITMAMLLCTVLAFSVGCEQPSAKQTPQSNYRPASQPVQEQPPQEQTYPVERGDAGQTPSQGTPIEVERPTELTPIPPASGPAAGNTPAAPVAGGTYTIQKGDTIYSISRKLYGTDTRAKEILSMNPGVDPKKLKIGQEIKVPAK